ncbi:hypothetical protein C2845_PM11G14770 [Panicum miliaceum]|uniref:F-box domain-containing protein n=1 Tax=Panicum miliaceum TaxID=4540 RepID=A0A3L6RPD5_PANMI|nr:hypothetical protein C2845_PM11G14770 [Panicum miliaceum]
MAPDACSSVQRRVSASLSDGHQDILHSILSRLSIRQAARTSILSNHWKHVWRCRTNLEFSFRSLVYKKGSGIPRSHISEYVFIQRVNAVLRQHSGVGVEKLGVEFSPLHHEHAEHIDRWVKFAIASKTKQLILDFHVQRRGKEPYTFPFQLFDATNASHLQSMKLGSMSLKQHASIKFFLNLKKLELEDVNITDEELKVMLCSCNVLEFIGISRCKVLTCLHTSHPMNRIKHLQVSHCPLLRQIELHFGLITFEYEGPLMPLAPPSTLRNISMKSSDICSALEYMFTELPSTLRCLESLSLTSEEQKRATLLNRTLKFLYLRHARLELNFVFLGFGADVLDLACLLQAAPILEKLEIHSCQENPIAERTLALTWNLRVVGVVKVRRRDVENVNPRHLIDPYWIAVLAEDES